MERPIAELLSSPEEHRRVGPFVLEHQLGRGGAAPVWKARQVLGNKFIRAAAVKLFAASPTGGDSEAARYDAIVEEARALCRVEHAGVVRFYELVTDERRGLVALAMEYVQGQSLETRLQEDGQLGVPEAVAVGLAVASALSAVHAAGLVHRDVKPANIVQTKAGTKLIDFGIAAAEGPAHETPAAVRKERVRVVDDLPFEVGGTKLSLLDKNTIVGDAGGDASNPFAGICGTIGYIDPECVASGTKATTASDLYALGATLFECLTGKLPAVAASSEGGLRGDVLDGSKRAPSLAQVAPGMPERLVDLVDALLDPAPRFRPPHADGVVAKLRAIADEIAVARPAPRPSGPRSKKPVVYAAAAMLVLAGAGAAIAHTISARRDEEALSRRAGAISVCLTGAMPGARSASEAMRDVSLANRRSELTGARAQLFGEGEWPRTCLPYVKEVETALAESGRHELTQRGAGYWARALESALEGNDLALAGDVADRFFEAAAAEGIVPLAPGADVPVPIAAAPIHAATFAKGGLIGVTELGDARWIEDRLFVDVRDGMTQRLCVFSAQGVARCSALPPGAAWSSWSIAAGDAAPIVATSGPPVVLYEGDASLPTPIDEIRGAFVEPGGRADLLGLRAGKLVLERRASATSAFEERALEGATKGATGSFVQRDLVGFVDREHVFARPIEGKRADDVDLGPSGGTVPLCARGDTVALVNGDRLWVRSAGRWSPTNVARASWSLACAKDAVIALALEPEKGSAGDAAQATSVDRWRCTASAGCLHAAWRCGPTDARPNKAAPLGDRVVYLAAANELEGVTIGLTSERDVAAASRDVVVVFDPVAPSPRGGRRNVLASGEPLLFANGDFAVLLVPTMDGLVAIRVAPDGTFTAIPYG